MDASCAMRACFLVCRPLPLLASEGRSGKDMTCLSGFGGFKYGPYSLSFSTGGGGEGDGGV